MLRIMVQTYITFILCVGSYFLHAAETVDTEVSVVKDEAIRISNLDDFYYASQLFLNVNAGWVDQSTDQFDSVCVYSTTGSYTVRATGLSPQGDGVHHQVADGSGNYMRYRVWWWDTTWRSLLSSGVSTAPLVGANTVDEDCDGGVNAFIGIRLTGADFASAPQGTYNDVLTFILEPE